MVREIMTSPLLDRLLMDPYGNYVVQSTLSVTKGYAPFTLYPISYTLYPIPYTLYPIPFILYPISYTLYPIPYILYPKPKAPVPYTPNPKPFTLCPIPYTLNLSFNAEPYPPNPKPYTLVSKPRCFSPRRTRRTTVWTWWWRPSVNASWYQTPNYKP